MKQETRKEQKSNLDKSIIFKSHRGLFEWLFVWVNDGDDCQHQQERHPSKHRGSSLMRMRPWTITMMEVIMMISRMMAMMKVVVWYPECKDEKDRKPDDHGVQQAGRLLHLHQRNHLHPDQSYSTFIPFNCIKKTPPLSPSSPDCSSQGWSTAPTADNDGRPTLKTVELGRRPVLQFQPDLARPHFLALVEFLVNWSGWFLFLEEDNLTSVLLDLDKRFTS